MDSAGEPVDEPVHVVQSRGNRLVESSDRFDDLRELVDTADQLILVARENVLCGGGERGAALDEGSDVVALSDQ